jgi:hypothetical protein
LHPYAQQSTICRSSCLLAANLPLLPRRFQLPVALPEDLLLPTGQHVLRRDLARGAVQADVYQAPRIIERIAGRMHSPLSDLRQRSIFLFDCG